MCRTYMQQMESAIKKYPDFWDYYGIHRNKEVNDYFENPLHFIEYTFIYAEKKLLVPTNKYTIGYYDWQNSQLSMSRAAHSVSTFLLGAIIAHNLFDGAFSGLYSWKPSENVSVFYEFSYIWTLICLYHDCGYYFEQDEMRTSKYSRVADLELSKRDKNSEMKKYRNFFEGLSRNSIDTSQYDKRELIKIISNTYLDIEGKYIKITPPKNCVDILKKRFDDMKCWIDIKTNFNSNQGEFIIEPVCV